MADKLKPKTFVRATTHPGDTRPNSPTAELESLARPEEQRPSIVRYARDTTLDTQLVWKGKSGPPNTRRTYQEAVATLRHAVRDTTRRHVPRRAD